MNVRVGSAGLGGPLLHLDTVGSTNDRARELALGGAPHGTTVVAQHQTTGRGRQGRTWLAERGDALTVSIVLRIEIERLHLLPLAAPLGVCDAVELVSDLKAQIKWPNDVWVGERKLAGILVEARPQEGWAVLGIGLNTRVREFPAELAEIATSLYLETDDEFDNTAVLTVLLDQLGVRFAADPQRLLDDYRARDLLNGRQISWADREGTAQGIDEHGNLVVFTPDGERVTLDAGEVHLEKLQP